ncbi:MAG TPA: response regulator transcription factor [Gaiellaceae bacterium]|nr:response regulator transcription factor [Gaiellaceae bacterium]
MSTTKEVNHGEGNGVDVASPSGLVALAFALAVAVVWAATALAGGGSSATGGSSVPAAPFSFAQDSAPEGGRRASPRALPGGRRRRLELRGRRVAETGRRRAAALFDNVQRTLSRFTGTDATMAKMTRNGGTSNNHRILVVDDEPSIVDAVATALRYEGFDVEEAATGREALDAVAIDEPDLIVLDWMLPDIEGIEVGRRLRACGFKTAILFLTAKDATENKVEALRAGGDDYVTKPFSLAEIVARAYAILRRTAGDLPGDVLSFEDVVLDEARHEVFRGDTPIALTATEFSLLRYLMLNPRRVLSKGQILQNVWRYDFGGNSNVVETYISYLRRKLHAAGPPIIKTVRQAGYMLERKP